MRHTIWVVLLLAASVSAQTVGNYPLLPDSSTVNLPPPSTVVDLNSGATTSGTISTVVIRSNRNDCTNGFKVKFFRQSGSLLTPIAERGPFSISGSITKVTLTPAVTVAAGDLIGITQLADCTGTVGQRTTEFKNAVHFSGDVTTSVNISTGNVLCSFALAAYGASAATTEVRTQVIMVAGAAAGANGAQFKSDVFMANPRSTRAAGRLVYHAEVRSGAATDPSVPFAIDTVWRTGNPACPSRWRWIASLRDRQDCLSSTAMQRHASQHRRHARLRSPLRERARGTGVVVHAGTKGFTFDALPLQEALQPFQQGVLFAPQNTSRFRMNVGVRTLDAPARVEYLALDSNGFQRAFVTKDDPANYRGVRVWLDHRQHHERSEPAGGEGSEVKG